MITQPIDILGVETLVPPHRHEGPAVEDAFMSWLGEQDRATRVKAKRILQNAGVEARHSFLPLEDIFRPRCLTSSMQDYRRHAIELGTQTLESALNKVGLKPSDIDILVTTSCTGFMIPSVDAYMAERLNMRSDLIRLPVTEMGCAAGVSSVIYATQMLRGRESGVAAVVNIEFPTNTMQHHDFDFDNIVATALFSDGIACTILRKGGEPGPAAIEDCAMHRVNESTHILGYQLTSTGLSMNLDKSLPDVIGEHFHAAIHPMLERNQLTIDDLQHVLAHPGGIKILDRIQELLDPHGKDISVSRDIMRRFGNMSSATVAFILAEFLKNTPAPGPGLMMSFGPGFGAHQLLLRFGDRKSA